jgi:hypothetical protein
MWLALLLVAFLPVAASAQQAEPAAGERGAELRVFVMTMGPGDAVWERFGHNAIWIRDDRQGTDIAYNYGMFSFEQDNFILRFIRGHMDYWMEGFDAELTANSYIYADRSVWAQELNLSPGQRADLRDFLEWNALPENRMYRYDYYRDNCSTRVRDALDRVLGGDLSRQTGSVPTGTTYRDHTRALTAADPLLYTGLMTGLGQPVDVQISAWEEMFLPMRLRERIREVSIVTPSGESVPLVAREFELYGSSRTIDESIPPSRWWVYLIVGSLIGGALVGLARSVDVSRRARLGAMLLAGSWSLVAGLLGVVLVSLWAFTDHEAAYRNENILQLSPLLLALFVLLPRLLRGPEAAGGRELPSRIAYAVAALSVVGLVAQLLPGFSQGNADIIALALPVNLGLAGFAYLRRDGSRRSLERPRGVVERRPAAAGA